MNCCTVALMVESIYDGVVTPALIASVVQMQLIDCFGRVVPFDLLGNRE